MLARGGQDLPARGKWSLEVKLDGIRAIAIKDGAQVRLFSRRRSEMSQHYPEIAQAVCRLPAQKLMVDGEIVALDEQGRSSFQLLQNVQTDAAARRRIFYVMFDMLNWDGTDTTAWPLAQRRKLLRRFTPSGGVLKFSASLNGTFSRVWELVQKFGLEGIVAKRQDSHYEAGRRSGAWVKIKMRKEQEFVIGGYTPPEGQRAYFGAVLVGYYMGEKFLCAGRVGTGFDDAALKELYLQFQKLRVEVCPFSNLPTRKGTRSWPGVTKRDMMHYTWLQPRLVCQVKFMEWTRDHTLRQPVFLGLRQDKEPADVVKAA